MRSSSRKTLLAAPPRSSRKSGGARRRSSPAGRSSARLAWREARSSPPVWQPGAGRLDWRPMTPREVAQTLREISQLLQIKGENAFKVRAYEMGADAFETLPADPAAPGGLNERVKKGTLTELDGIGKAISEKVTELVNTGRLRFLDDLRKEFPLGALDLMRVPGLGPRKAAVLIRELDVANLDDLERVAREGRVRG